MKRNTILHILFAIIVIIELIGRITDNISFEYPVKPLVMVWIAVYFLLNRQKKEFTIPVLLAFFFSWTGDMFLMFADKSDMLFYAGVGGFFFSQLSYIYTFSKYSEEKKPGLIQRKPALIFIFFAYLAGIYIILDPCLVRIMKPIILLYALSLITMSIMALNRRGRVNYRSFILVFTGSLLFIISDSMIALTKFCFDIPMAGLYIMITYVSAQYLIMRGLIRQ